MAMMMTGAWIACKGRSGEEVRAILRVRETARGTWVPDGFEIWGAQLKEGWYLVSCCDLSNPCVAEEAPLVELSGGCMVVAALAVSFGPQEWSRSVLYQDGVQLWRVSQHVQDDRSEVKVEGTPPQGFSPDLYRRAGTPACAPLDLAYGICGYRHGLPAQNGELRFAELVPQSQQSPSA
jgi:hypothetical protein